LGRLARTPCSNAGLMSADTSRTPAGSPPWAARAAPPLHGGVIAALGREHDPGLGGVQVDEQRDVVVAAAGRRLVDADPAHLGQVQVRPGGVDVVVQQPPQPGVVLADQRGGRLDGHLGQQRYQ
jgi:hypothetical protein